MNTFDNSQLGQTGNNLQNGDTRERIVAVQKNGDGDLTAFKTSSGRELDYTTALQEVQAGRIAGVNAFKGRDGETYIRGDADGDPTNNLDNLPMF
ncbi:DUF3892 domain-containing protein [Paenibacillus nanensis]|uniref:DUF3892 domain-containing protein n=1 Tax=Paenibacillus nanensis TaxID=393251 RepID=A0A3A1UQC8_9BACL|nr:DUF3892 domain-containing protein [Paenibacillus nanensis]RIX49986.1 DUF3892 domain-containing protein [Paenibacillus nanensis]